MSQIGGPAQDARGSGSIESGARSRTSPKRCLGAEAESGRVVALDLGSRRIGVAYSDTRRTLASPWGMVERSGDPVRDQAAVVAVIEEIGARTVVVGLPLSLSGARGPAAQAALGEVADLRQTLEPLGITVETADERFTTVEAQRSLTAAGRKGRASRSVIDSAAAMVLLQAWLDRRDGAGGQ